MQKIVSTYKSISVGILFLAISLNAMEKQESLLIASIEKNDSALFRQALAANRNGIYITDAQGNFPLIVAIKKVNVTFVKGLIGAGADVKVQDRNGNGALLLAALACKKSADALQIIDDLIQAGALCDTRGQNGNTALICAVFIDNIPLAEKLIKARSNVNLANNSGETPLMLASASGNEAMVKVLMGAGADTRAKNKESKTAFDVAATEEIKKLLTDEPDEFDLSNLSLNNVSRHRESMPEKAVDAGASKGKSPQKVTPEYEPTKPTYWSESSGKISPSNKEPVTEKAPTKEKSIDIKKSVAEGNRYYLAKEYAKAFIQYISVLDLRDDYIAVADQYDELAARVEAAVHLGEMYYLGQGIEQNVYMAKRNFELVVSHVENLTPKKICNPWARAQAYARLGIINSGNAGEYHSALYYLEQATKQEDNKAAKGEALFGLAELNCYEDGMRVDYVKARTYYELVMSSDASSRTKAMAAFKLAGIYVGGHKEVEKDLAKARFYWELAANQEAHQESKVGALLCLGHLYNDCTDSESSFYKDYAKARSYYEKVITYDILPVLKAQAWLKLAAIYHFGRGVTVDYSRALIFYELAANQGNDVRVRADARANLGQIYHNGGHGISQDYSKARSYYELAVNQNDDAFARALAQSQLGTLFEEGKGVEVNYAKAKFYYELAVKQEENVWAKGLACSRLGQMYHLGKGIKVDYAQARHYYELAVKQNAHGFGRALACAQLGCIYHLGQGIKVDYTQARSYYSLAANQTENQWAKDVGEKGLRQIGQKK